MLLMGTESTGNVTFSFIVDASYFSELFLELVITLLSQQMIFSLCHLERMQ